MEPNHKLLIIYDYFDPAYKAGGPIRSLVNLVQLLEGEFKISIITTNQDHDGTELKVKTNCWLEYGKNSRIQYLSGQRRNFRDISRLIREVSPDTIYLNGIYSLRFFLYPLLTCRNMKNVKVVIAPRGMLQKTSLSIKPMKKKLYLSILKTFLIHNEIIWHVTTEQEQEDLFTSLGKATKLKLIGNIPSYNSDVLVPTQSTNSQKVFGTVALISPMKNIHLILDALKDLDTDIIYYLYGPVKDEIYWNECLRITKDLSDRIKFKYEGDLPPDKVPGVITEFDFYIQPSRSENFGHSIFEAFNQGIPVIISDQTPWKNLFERKAGWDVDIKESGSLKFAIEQALGLDEKTYLEFRQGARRIAEEYMESNDFVKLYKELFGN